MSLDVRLLEKVRDLVNGLMQARCPACAEGGGDRAAEHLRIYPDGRFGCCVHPKDREHRKRIFALAGDKSIRRFKVKVASRKPVAKPASSVNASLTGLLRTLRTPVYESVSTSSESQEVIRTLRTPISIPHTYTRKDTQIMSDDAHIYKGFQEGVLSVLTAPTAERLPFLTPVGDLSIPFDSPERFHWWKGGQSVADTRAEVESWMRAGARKEHDGTGF